MGYMGNKMTQEELSGDTWAWQKYGRKPIKGSPYPRKHHCSYWKALVSLALFGAFVSRAGISVVDVLTPKVFIGLLVGAMLPYWFSAMTMKSVGSAALKMVEEVRRKFNTIQLISVFDLGTSNFIFWSSFPVLFLWPVDLLLHYLE